MTFVLISGFTYFIFFSIILFLKNIHLLLLYPKHDIKPSWYNLGYYINSRIQKIEHQGISLATLASEDLDNFLNTITIVEKQRWYTKITLKIDPDYKSTFITLINSGVDLNCIQERLIPTTYFVKTSQRLSTTSNVPLKVQYEILKGHI